MRDWISVAERLPNRDEPCLELLVSVITKDDHEVMLVKATGKFIKNSFVIDEYNITAPRLTSPIVAAWKEPTAQQYAKNFKIGKYFINRDTPKMPTKTTYKYPNQ